MSENPTEITPVSKLLGHYLVQEELGKGGMGTVYKAIDTRVQRVVALKILHATLLDETESKRFLREVTAIAALDHPNIVKLFEVGSRPYYHFAMEYVAGVTLRVMIREQGKIPPQQAASILMKCANAVSEIHKAGLIHRDIKPSNVLIDKYGNPKMMDFGLAKERRNDSSLSKSGEIMGTPAYMPPEQATGNAVDKRADIYSLGATLYQMLTGVPPYEGNSAIVIVTKIATEDPIAPRKIDPSIPADLEAICLKCLARSPRKRYVNSRQLADDLHNFINGRPVAAQNYSYFKNWYRTARQKPLLIAVNFIVLIALLLVSLLFLWQQRTADTMRQTLDIQKGTYHSEIITRHPLYLRAIQRYSWMYQLNDQDISDIAQLDDKACQLLMASIKFRAHCQFEKAHQSMLQLLVVAPDNGFVWLNAALNYYKEKAILAYEMTDKGEGLLKKAKYCFAKALSVHPDYKTASFCQDFLKIFSERNNDVVIKNKALQELKHNPHSANAYVILGTYYFLEHDKTLYTQDKNNNSEYLARECQNYLHKALSLSPNNSIAYFILAKLLEQNKDQRDQTQSNYQLAILCGPSNYFAHIYLSVFYYQQQDFWELKNEFSNITRYAKGSSLQVFFDGVLKARAGKYREGHDSLLKISRYPWASEQLGIIYFEQKLWQQAIDKFTQITSEEVHVKSLVYLA